MHIKLCRKRTHASILLGVLIIAVGLLLGGCVVKKIISTIKKVDKQIQNAATNDPPADIVNSPILPGTETQKGIQVENAIAPSPTGAAPKFQVNTNYYNAALEDESGF